MMTRFQADVIVHCIAKPCLDPPNQLPALPRERSPNEGRGMRKTRGVLVQTSSPLAVSDTPLPPTSNLHRPASAARVASFWRLYRTRVPTLIPHHFLECARPI